MSDQALQELESVFPNLKRDELLAQHTYIKIGGPAKFFLSAQSSDELIRAVEIAESSNIKWCVFGSGSNVLISDEGFDGLIIQSADRSFSVQGTKVTAASGALTSLVANSAAKAGLQGFEWATTLPGTIGGAVYGNAGCFGGEMKDVVTSVEIYDLKNKERVTLSNCHFDRSGEIFKKDTSLKDCKFGYRDSIFKYEPLLILKVELELKAGEAETSLAKVKEIMETRRAAQPKGVLTAGCMFKNFKFEDESELEKLKREFEVPQSMLDNKIIYAGWLIDKLGLKGKTIGKAQISPEHGNFMVNLGGARAQNVIALTSLVKMKVRDELGIMLSDEVQYLGF
ncbi:MAG: UDP-N-acetylmuramate dehydrogenase [Patescibacteria group bacterium]|nr:UDP-N-acetylmuramate dehydrogenase [Patescibacteria group bacterium]